ncbi:MAG TPA: hypothetical protein VGE51_00360 [Fontimonas sp.]
MANPSIDEERSYIAPANSLDGARLKTLWSELEARAEKYFADAQFAAQEVTAKYQMKMRYPGQNWALAFDIRVNPGLHDLSFVDATLGEQAIALFNRRHTEEFGHIREGEMPEVTGIRLVTSVETPSPKVLRGTTAERVQAQAKKSRRANLGKGFADTPIHFGAELKPGHEVQGPAIIEETFTTIVVYPGWKAQVDDAGDYELIPLA